MHEQASLSPGATSKTAREYADRLLAWLEDHRDVPFFAFLHVLDPHDPFEPRAPYDALFADPARKATFEKDEEAVKKKIADPLMQAFGMPSRAELKEAGVDPDAYIAHVKGRTEISSGLRVAVDQAFHVVFLFGTALLAVA